MEGRKEGREGGKRVFLSHIAAAFSAALQGRPTFAPSLTLASAPHAFSSPSALLSLSGLERQGCWAACLPAWLTGWQPAGRQNGQRRLHRQNAKGSRRRERRVARGIFFFTAAVSKVDGFFPSSCSFSRSFLFYHRNHDDNTLLLLLLLLGVSDAVCWYNILLH